MQLAGMHTYTVHQGVRAVAAGPAVAGNSYTQVASGTGPAASYTVHPNAGCDAGPGGFWFEAVRQIEEAVDYKVQQALQDIISFAGTCNDQLAEKLAEERDAREKSMMDMRRLLEEQNVRTVEVAQKTATAALMNFEDFTKNTATAACQLEAELDQMRSYCQSARQAAQRDAAQFRSEFEDLKAKQRQHVADMLSAVPTQDHIHAETAAIVEATSAPLKRDLAAQQMRLQELDGLHKEVASAGTALREKVDCAQEGVMHIIKEVREAQVQESLQIQARLETLERQAEAFKGPPPEVAVDEVASIRLLIEALRSDTCELRARVDQQLADWSAQLEGALSQYSAELGIATQWISGEAANARDATARVAQFSENLALEVQALRAEADQLKLAMSPMSTCTQTPSGTAPLDSSLGHSGNGDQEYMSVSRCSLGNPDAGVAEGLENRLVTELAAGPPARVPASSVEGQHSFTSYALHDSGFSPHSTSEACSAVAPKEALPTFEERVGSEGVGEDLVDGVLRSTGNNQMPDFVAEIGSDVNLGLVSPEEAVEPADAMPVNVSGTAPSVLSMAHIGVPCPAFDGLIRSAGEVDVGTQGLAGIPAASAPCSASAPAAPLVTPLGSAAATAPAPSPSSAAPSISSATLVGDQRGLKRDGCGTQAIKSATSPTVVSAKVQHMPCRGASMPSQGSGRQPIPQKQQMAQDQLSETVVLSGSSSQGQGMSASAQSSQLGASLSTWRRSDTTPPTRNSQTEARPLTSGAPSAWTAGKVTAQSGPASAASNRQPQPGRVAQAPGNYVQVPMGGPGWGMMMMQAGQCARGQGLSPQRARSALSTSPVRTNTVAPLAAPHVQQQTMPEWTHAGIRTGRVASPRREVVPEPVAPRVGVPRSISPTPMMGPAAAAAAAEAAALAALRRS